MKNLIVSASVILATAFAPVMASETRGEDPRAERVFAQEFVGAQNVKWTKLDEGYLRVSFVLNGVAAETYFDADGEMLGTVRNLFFNQLPLAVAQSVNKKFTNAVILEVQEITNEEGTSYKLVFEHDSRKYNVRLNGQGDLTSVAKEKLKK